MELPTHPDERVIARYSLFRCVAWSAGWIAVCTWILWMPFASGRFELDGQYAWFWPIGALAAVYMAVTAVALMFRAVTFGGRVVSVRGDDLVIDYPFRSKSFRLVDLSSAWPSEHKVDGANYAVVPNLFKVPTVAYVPQVTIAFHGGNTVNLPTGLLGSSAAQIANGLNAIVANRVAGHGSRHPLNSPS